MTRHLYMALGDSVTAGYEASMPNRTFVNLLSQQLQHISVTNQTVLVARSGWTSSQLLGAARSIPPSVWDETKITTLLIGGNDLRKQFYPIVASPDPYKTVDRYLGDISIRLFQLYEYISQKKLPRVLSATMYNPAPNSPLVTYAITQLNQIITEGGSQYDFEIVDLYTAFAGREPQLINRYKNGSLEDLFVFFGRPIHPNDAGHQVIADAFDIHLHQ